MPTGVPHASQVKHHRQESAWNVCMRTSHAQFAHCKHPAAAARGWMLLRASTAQHGMEHILVGRARAVQVLQPQLVQLLSAWHVWHVQAKWPATAQYTQQVVGIQQQQAVLFAAHV
eukprot:GHRR01004608.1.p2 GENE.GHRR01004608.1~~GHRR01004608.1.p2  ORF type:complete len:116 (+),score=22.27 GHRR01004608.1:1567-1914(+)